FSLLVLQCRFLSFIFLLCFIYYPFLFFFFFFNDPPPTEIYTLSLHDALPISTGFRRTRERTTSCISKRAKQCTYALRSTIRTISALARPSRSETPRKSISRSPKYQRRRYGKLLTSG